MVKEATMAMNMVQFQKGMSLDSFQKEYGTEKQCAMALEKAKWPEGFECPECGHKLYCIVWHKKVKTYQCNSCHCQTTLNAGTIFQSTRLSLRQWFLAMFFMTQSKNCVAALELKRLLGICYRSAWRLKHKLSQVMTERECNRQLGNTVQVDDAYLGGQKTGGKAGRGSENKVPFIAAVATNENGHPSYMVLSTINGFSKTEVTAWAETHLAAGSKVVTDGLNCFNAFSEAGFLHLPEVVGNERKSTDLPMFKWINTLLGNIKNALSGTLHAFKYGKYAKRYLSEIQYRFNRRFELKTIVTRFLYACAQTSAWPEYRLRMAER
jgi:predicted RNA-binding Zn-ribbon protein involved in translation (DUF1610 family)